MMLRYKLFFAICLIGFNGIAQLTEEIPPVTDILPEVKVKTKSGVSEEDKSHACGIDTLYYSRYNLTANYPKYLNLQPTKGAGMYFAVDDTVWLHGFNFFGYVLDAIGFFTSETVTCKVYYANSNRLPAGIALASGTHNFMATGVSTSQLRQKFLFSSPVMLVSDFIVTIEFAANLNSRIVLASNDYDSSDGKGNNYSAVKLANGWSNNLVVGTTPFDADFYIEPVVEYKLTADYDHGLNSCLGNGLPFAFVNTTTFALNPQFSKEAIDNTLDDNFIWDYGDGSAADTILHGNHYYSAAIGYFVSLSATFKNWRNITCSDDTAIFLEEGNVKAGFQSTANGLIVSFTDKSVDAKTWEWDFGDGSTGSVQQNPNHMYSQYGLYGVKQKARNKGCVDSVILWINLKDPTGIDVQTQKSLFVEISPNPASDKIFIESNILENEGGTWQIISIQGKELMSGNLLKSDEISIKDLPSGLYFIKFLSGNSTLTKRLIVN